MKNVVILVSLLVLALIASSSKAYALDCPVRMPQVYMKTTSDPLEKIEKVSPGGLARMHGGSYRPGQPHVLGLGGGSYALKFDIEFDTKASGSLSCVGMKAIRGTFHISPAILVASNYRKGSCEYKAVMEHEMEHVNILRRFQSLYAARYQLLLQEIASEHKRYTVNSSVNAAWHEKQVEQAITVRIEQFMREIKPVLQKRQLKHDSPEEYARVAAQCTGW